MKKKINKNLFLEWNRKQQNKKRNQKQNQQIDYKYFGKCTKTLKIGFVDD